MGGDRVKTDVSYCAYIAGFLDLAFSWLKVCQKVNGKSITILAY
jgi:hypothetical protein